MTDSRSHQNNKAAFAIACAAGGLWLSFFYAGMFVGTERFVEDMLFSARPVRSDIAVIAIDDESIARLGQWPWPRAHFARALKNLETARPRAVALDVMLSEPSRAGAADDAELAAVLAALPYPVVMPVEIAADGASLKPLPAFVLSSAVSLGHVGLSVDPDGVARFIRPTQGGFPSLAYYTAGKEAGADLVRIAYAGPPGSVRRIPFWRAFEGALSGEPVGTVFFIGATAVDLHDEQMTPFSDGTAMPGVEIQAQIADMLLSGSALVPVPRPYMALWILLAAFLPAFFFMLMPGSLWPFFCVLLALTAELVFAIMLFERGYAASMVHAAGSLAVSSLAVFAWRYFSTNKEKREMRVVFSKYVSKDVLESILRNAENVVLGGEERTITVFFSDIRGFTSHSERMRPQELVRVLNAYFTEMVKEITAAGGVLDKYIGDAIMAFWGAPLPDGDQADRAVQASVRMVARLKALNEKFIENGDPAIAIGIGLYSGPAIVGNIGAEDRFDYTAIGDTVNVASRLEGLNKEFGTTIIIGETTKNMLKEAYDLRSLGSVQVKGRAEPLSIWSVET